MTASPNTSTAKNMATPALMVNSVLYKDSGANAAGSENERRREWVNQGNGSNLQSVAGTTMLLNSALRLQIAPPLKCLFPPLPSSPSMLPTLGANKVNWRLLILRREGCVCVCICNDMLCDGDMLKLWQMVTNKSTRQSSLGLCLCDDHFCFVRVSFRCPVSRFGLLFRFANLYKISPVAFPSPRRAHAGFPRLSNLIVGWPLPFSHTAKD